MHIQPFNIEHECEHVRVLYNLYALMLRTEKFFIPL